MLKVKTYLDKSEIHGIGVFAGEDIEKNQIIWCFDERFDKVIDVEDVLLLSISEHAFQNEITFIYKYAYHDKQLNKWILSSDNDRFTNHSRTANTKPLENGCVVAARDIRKGEELTINYYDIDEFAHEKLNNI